MVLKTPGPTTEAVSKFCSRNRVCVCCLYIQSVCKYHGFHDLMVYISPQRRITFDPAGYYAVDGLKSDTPYMFSLAAKSDIGLGVFTQPIEARTTQSSKYYSLLMSLCFGLLLL